VLSPAFAGDLQFWPATEIRLLDTSRLRLDVTATARTRDRLSEVYDSRIGIALRVPVHHRLGIAAGYLRRFVDPDGQSRHQQNRFWFGPRVLVLQAPVTIHAIALFERHMNVVGTPDFNRYRLTMEMERVRKGFSPFLTVESAVRDGTVQRSRNMAGLRWRDESGYSVEFGYQFEAINTGPAWAPRHSVRSTFRWERALFGRRDSH
jgi:hypothetical protein